MPSWVSRAVAAILLFAVPAAAGAQVDPGAQGDVAQSRNTEGLPAALQGIDDVLAGGLLNDPTTLEWDTYGADLSREFKVDESYPGGGAAVRLRQRRAGEVYASGLNIPLLATVPAGETITVGFYARMIESRADDAMGKVGVRFQLNREPYPGFGDSVVNVGPEWKWYEVSAVADRELDGDGIVALQFGLARQTVEIGQAIVVSGVNAIN